MKQVDVLVIGSSAAGLVAATTAKNAYPDKKITVIRAEEKTLVPCGIPYIFESVGSTENDLMPSEKMFDAAGIDLVIGEAVSINREEKSCTLRGGEKFGYSKLVLATGSKPTKPAWLKGAELQNVFTVPKDKVYLDAMQASLKGCTKVVVIGAGFIGVELSDELAKSGKEVLIVEKLPHILALAFDEDIAVRIEKLLVGRGVSLRTGIGVREIIGEDRVTGVLLENGESLEADAVILSIGYKPDSRLAAAAGLSVSEAGFIRVDEYMRTRDPNVFAVGDCAEKRDFFTRKPNPIMLASTACAEARTAGINLFKLSAIKTFYGTLSIFATALGETGFGVAGLTEKKAREEGFDIVTGVFEGMDKHPGTLPGTQKQLVKLIFGNESGILLGGEVIGGHSVGELTNMIGLVIQNRMNVSSILTSQIGTHPLLTASPAGYPFLKAAGIAARKRIGLL